MSNPGTDTRTRILNTAVILFATKGFDGVSMRTIANEIGIKAPSLYNHFPNKHALYLSAMTHAFAEKAKGINEVVSAHGSPQERLNLFIDRFTRLMADDPGFRKLLQRELLDGDEQRLRVVAEQVFNEPFESISMLAKELDPDCDPHMLAISIAGLVLFHFETAPVRRFLPGEKDTHENSDIIAGHVKRLLSKAFGAKE